MRTENGSVSLLSGLSALGPLGWVNRKFTGSATCPIELPTFSSEYHNLNDYRHKDNEVLEIPSSLIARAALEYRNIEESGAISISAWHSALAALRRVSLTIGNLRNVEEPNSLAPHPAFSRDACAVLWDIRSLLMTSP